MLNIRLAILLILMCCLPACSSVGYYSQIVSGHMQIVMGKRPIQEVLASSDTTELTRRRLTVASDARLFAIEVLGLPGNESYTSFYDTGRPYVTWNVVAAAEFSLTPEQWCFPIAGCVSYRGYYALEDADRYAKKLSDSGLDTAVNGATAYSTLGWFVDPLLSTMLNRSDAAIAGLIFHELAHQQLYVSDDSTFNESFATFVEIEGLKLWQSTAAQQSNQAVDVDYEARMNQRAERQKGFLDLLNSTKTELELIYQSDIPIEEMRMRKQQQFQKMAQQYGDLKASWNGYEGYDRWFATAPNNARLAAVGTYNDFLPAFKALFAQVDSDFPSFYQAAKELGELPKTQRRERISQLSSAQQVELSLQ